MSRATLLAHQAACRSCHACVDDGIIPEANPTFEGRWGAPFMLVGQAPGPTERVSRRPFSGRAGKELDRWMIRAGFESAEQFRHLTYIAALMRCFPGRNRAGNGDLKPPPAAVAPAVPAQLRAAGGALCPGRHVWRSAGAAHCHRPFVCST